MVQTRRSRKEIYHLNTTGCGQEINNPKAKRTKLDVEKDSNHDSDDISDFYYDRE